MASVNAVWLTEVGGSRFTEVDGCHAAETTCHSGVCRPLCTVAWFIVSYGSPYIGFVVGFTRAAS